MRVISFGNRHLLLAGRKMLIFRYLYPPLSTASSRAALKAYRCFMARVFTCIPRYAIVLFASR